MAIQPLTSPTHPTMPVEPVIRHCRDVVAQSAHVTRALLADPARDLRVIRRVNPALATALTPFLDAVMTLDATTGFLDDPGL